MPQKITVVNYLPLDAKIGRGLACLHGGRLIIIVIWVSLDRLGLCQDCSPVLGVYGLDSHPRNPTRHPTWPNSACGPNRISSLVKPNLTGPLPRPFGPFRWFDIPRLDRHLTRPLAHLDRHMLPFCASSTITTIFILFLIFLTFVPPIAIQWLFFGIKW